MIRRKFIYDDNNLKDFKEVFLDDLGFSEDDFKELDTKRILNLISEKFIDFRLFGQLFQILGAHYGITGPIQFENSFSLNIPNIFSIPITSTLASESNKGAGAMGKYIFLDYALFSIHGIVKNSLAMISKATESDIFRLFDGLWNGLKSLNTRSKFGQNPRLLLSFVMKEPGYQIPRLRNIFNETKIPKKGVSITDFTINLGRLEKILKLFKTKIEKIEFKEDPILKYDLKSKIYDSITEISNTLEDTPKFEMIE